MAKKKPTAADPNAIYNQLGQDFGQATNFYNQYIDHNKLGRLDPTRSAETQNALNVRHAYGDPSSDAFAGKYSPDALEMINKYKGRLNPNSQDYAGATSKDTQALLDQRKAASQTGYVRTNDMMDIVNRFKSGLEGYTAAENTGIREAGTRSIRNTAASDAARNAAASARYGVRGPQAMAQMRNDMHGTRDALNAFDQDLAVRNIDEKQKRLNDYAGFTTGLESDEFGRSQGLINSYQDLLLGNEATNYGRVNDALNQYRDVQQSTDDRYYNRGQQAISDYDTALFDQDAITRAINTFNIGQGEKEQARDMGSMTSIVNLINTIRNQGQQNAILAKK